MFDASMSIFFPPQIYAYFLNLIALKLKLKIYKFFKMRLFFQNKNFVSQDAKKISFSH